MLRPGDEVVVLPSGATPRIAAIDTFDGPVAEAFPPMSVALRLEDDIDVSPRRHDRAGRTTTPTVSRELEAMVCWMTERAAARGRPLRRSSTRRARARGGRRAAHRIDVDTLHRDENAPARSSSTRSAACSCAPARRSRSTPTGATARPAASSSSTRRRTRRVAAGMILDPDEPVRRRDGATAIAARSSNVALAAERAHARGALGGARPRRRDGLVHRPAGVGQVDRRGARSSSVLVDAGTPAYLLDGDNLRHGLNGDLGFSRDRPRRERPPHRPGRAPARRRRRGRDRARSSAPTPPDRQAARARIHEAAGLRLRRGLRRHAARGVRAPRPEGPVREGARRRDHRASPASTTPTRRPESPDIVLLPDDPDPVGALLVALEDLGVQTAKADPEG